MSATGKLTTQQKHDLLIKFNEDREEIYKQYQENKVFQKEEFKKSGGVSAKEGLPFRKIYKQLGDDH